MATCKDCICYSGCSGILNDFGMRLNPAREVCDRFEDRARFVELPYKLGDSIYEPKRHQITEYQIARIVFYDFGLRMELRLMKGLLFRVEIKQEDIGKVVFLTREEAEQALKERENDE